MDLDKILLPKKGPAPETLMRVNAGAVLEASTPAPQVPRAPASPEAIQSLAQDIRREMNAPGNMPQNPPSGAPHPPLMTSMPAVPPAEPAAPPHEGAPVSAVRTYKSDIEEVVRDQNVSLVSIAAAQAKRGEQRGIAQEEAGTSWQKYAMYGGGAVLTLAALGLIAFVATRGSAPAQSAPTPTTAPLVYVDSTEQLTIAPNETGSELLTVLEKAREDVKLSLGLVARLYITQNASSSVSGVAGEYPAPALLGLIAPHAPQSLLRSLAQNYILGVHSFDGNQPFLIFKTSSYEQSYAGMLQWEPDMQADLSPLFLRTPRPHIPEEGTTTVPFNTQVVQTPFNDRIVENHDARVIQNQSGDILLLWAFVDRRTLVITTNEYTLREAITRLKSPPIVPIPGQ